MAAEYSSTAAKIFDENGRLRRNLFSLSARAFLDDCFEWIAELDRSILLPIDFVVTLLRNGEEDTEALLSQVIGSPREESSLIHDLESYARRVERPVTGARAFHVDAFSLGSIGILQDGYSWAHEVGRSQIVASDLTRAVRWRVEYQESASIRWVLKQLGQHNSDQLFDDNGVLVSQPFSTGFWKSMIRSAELSAEAGLPFVGTPQLIAAICTAPGSLLARTARDAGIRPERLRAELLRIVGNRSPSQPLFKLTRKTLTPRVIRMLEGATIRASELNRATHDIDVLLEFLKDGGSSLELIRALGIEAPLRKKLQKRAESHQHESLTEPLRHASVHVSRIGSNSSSSSEEGETNVIDSVGRDLTELARKNALPKVLGRKTELQRMLRVLMRTEQRNPLLTGQPGVGKTALAMALAQQIADGKVPSELQDSRVIEINGASLVGGTSYRGELEARLSQLIEEAEQENAILFIDEAHAVFAPTSGSGRPAETPNHFKTALASGKIAVIAATTTSEFRRWIEEDPALKRRFEQIAIDELPTTMTRKLLRHLATQYEEQWRVEIPQEILDDVIEFSNKFIPQRSQPDKAKKLLMDAAIHVRLHEHEDPASTFPMEPPLVDRQSVAEIVHQKTRIPMGRMLENSLDWWNTLEQRITTRVPDQEHAVRTLAQKLFQQRFRPHADEKPYGSLTLLTPHGVDSADFALSIAIECYGTEEAFTRIDMTDFTEPHAVTRLFGAPPGYVGYSDEDLLITPLRQRPAQVVLFSNFHSAHPRVQDRLIQLINSDSATDTRGYTADLRHAIFAVELPLSDDTHDIGFGRSYRATLNTEHAEIHGKLMDEGVATIQLTNPAQQSDARQVHIAHIIEQFVEHVGLEDRRTIDDLQAQGRAIARASGDDTTIPQLEAKVFEKIIEPYASSLFDTPTEEISVDHETVDKSST